MPEGTEKPLLEHFIEQIKHIDELAMVIIKGHLVIEQVLTRIIGKYVHHSNHIPDRLNFAQLVSLARSMSLDEADNSMWNLILAVNALRNKVAHSLESQERQKAYKRLKVTYHAEIDDGSPPEDEESHHLALMAMAHCLGFLQSFESEIDRFKEWLGTMDKIVNPHRHEDGMAST